MNISSFNYSKATTGLRQSDIIKDQQLKLIFVYPILTDQSLTKYSESIRDFIATSVLKEIFVSNALNMVSMAGQIYSLMDEKGNPVDIRTTQLNTLENNSSDHNYYNSNTISSKLSVHPLAFREREIQNKINEKTAVIKHLLSNDPQYKALRPFIEIITMDNLIDVPVVVGTKSWDINSSVMLFTLIGSIGLKKPLTSIENLNIIHNTIKKCDKNTIWTILDNLIVNDLSIKEKISKWFSENIYISPGVVSFYKFLGLNIKFNNLINFITPNKIRGTLTNASNIFKSIISTFSTKENPIDGTKLATDEFVDFSDQLFDSINKNILFFKYCLDPSLLKTKLNVDISQGQISTKFKEISIDIKNIYSNMMVEFNNYMVTYINNYIQSIVMLFININDNSDTNLLIQKVSSNIINSLNKITEESLLVSINSSLSSNEGIEEIKKVENTIKNIKKMCSEMKMSNDYIINLLNSNINDNTINTLFKSPNYDSDMLNSFVLNLNDVDSKIRTFNLQIQQMLNNVLISGSSTSILNKVLLEVNNILINFVNELTKNYSNNYDINYIDKTDNKSTAIDNFKVFKTTIIEAISNIILGLYLISTEHALCKYASLTEVSIETSKHNVLDYPNYTLIIPIEEIMLLASALATKSLQALENNSENRQLKKIRFQLADNYIKGIIKAIHSRIQVPNLFVIDENKEMIYYKLSYQSDIQQIKLNTLNTFSKLIVKNNMSSENYN